MADLRDWYLEVHVDPDWYESVGSPVPLPASDGPDRVLLTLDKVLVGRASKARNSSPQVDLTQDTGVSRRQAELVWRGEGWFVRDLGSANGTWLRHPDGREARLERETMLGDGDELLMGSWTRLVLRHVEG